MAVQNCDDSNKSDFIMHILVSFNDGTFGISTGQSFFKPKLPPKSDIDDWVTLLKSWLNNEKAVAVRWPGDQNCNSWNMFDYAEAPSGNENDKSLHSNAILKSGVIVFYSESVDEMRKERDKLILQANDKKYLKTIDAKQKFGYPTSRLPVAKKHSMNKNSVSAEKSATNLQSAQFDDNLLSSPLKSLEEDVIPQSTEKKRKQKKKSTSIPIEKSATSERILHPTAVNDNFSALKPLEEHKIPETAGKKHNQRKKSISIGKSPTSERSLYSAAANDNFSSPSALKPLEEHEIPETTGKKHNQREKSISIGKSPTSEISLHPSAVNDNLSSSPNPIEEDQIDETNSDSSLSNSSNSDSKLKEYYARCYTLERENRSLKEKISQNEIDLETYYNQIASKELQNLELCEQLEDMQNAQPIVLIKEMKDAIAEIGHLIHNIRIQPTQGQHVKCVAVITEKQINSAICAKLIGCHNMMKKRNHQQAKSQPSNSITAAADGSDAE